MKKTLYILFICLTTVLGSFAQSGLSGINYQAVARNSNGSVLANQAVSVRFSIRGGGPNGAVQYQETHNATTNALGLFTLQIGRGTPVTGSFSAVPWSNANQFIQVEVNTGGGFQTLGTQQLMSVPFALFAANGTVGPVGPMGPMGATGPAGAKGNDGATGPVGPVGPVGAIGPVGPMGATGPAGTKGNDGATGPVGPAGAAGNDGATGPRGPIGPAGATGPIGPVGPVGANGNDGATGPRGPIGPAGATGPIGPVGPVGANGNDGATGPIGPVGPAGANGNDGATGPRGPVGPAGANGNDGATGPIGPVGPAGANGNDGATGPIGPVGPAGANGNDGATGPIGPVGPAGANGNDGATGPIGPVGPAGANGNDGATGPRGPIGPVGPAGANGNDGATGPIGPIGPVGPAGANGNDGATGPAGPAADINGVAAGGDLSGTYPDPSIANGAVTLAKLAAGVIPTSLPPNGAAGGDLGGTYPNPAVAKLQGQPVSNTAPIANQVLRFDGTQWIPGAAPGASGLIIPYQTIENNAATLFSISNDGDGTSIEGISNSTTSSISAVRGIVTATSPGGFSTGVRGINNGTGGLGIGVWGSHNGSGWGVYGSAVNGLGVYGSTTANGTGVYANSHSGTGLQATSSNGIPAKINIFSISNNNLVLDASTVGNGDVISVNTTGNGKGIIANTTNGFAIQGITNAQTSAGIVGDNNNGGEAVVGRTTSNIAGAVVGRNDGGGYGVRGFIATSTAGTAVGVFGQVGLSNSTGRAGRFENYNANNTEANTFEVQSNGNGNIPDNTKGNAASFVLDNSNGVGAAVRAEVNTIFGNFGAAGIFGVSSGTGGYAGLFHAKNPLGNGPALVAIADGNGNAITANADNGGDAINASVSGTGNSLYAWVPLFATGRAGKFANFNSTNGLPTVEIANSGTGNAILINHDGSSGDIAVFQNNAVNVGRIDKTGRAFFNGGTQANGADVAEAFDVAGVFAEYEPGDVLVISKSTDRMVEKSAKPYSTLVAGVFATKPGLLLTEQEGTDVIDGQVPMGVVGVIPTKVCDEGGPIERGDLLVTSSRAGYAMKADPDKVKTGQVLGKALQELKAGTGKIKVLVNVK